MKHARTANIKRWKYSPHHREDAEGHIFMDTTGACTITLTGASSMPQEDLDRYGKLMSMAPELLWSLRMMLEAFDPYDPSPKQAKAYDRAARAIAKAETKGVR